MIWTERQRVFGHKRNSIWKDGRWSSEEEVKVGEKGKPRLEEQPCPKDRDAHGHNRRNYSVDRSVEEVG